MIMYKARLTARMDSGEDTPRGVKFAPILESAALDEYEGSWSVVVHTEGGEGGEGLTFSFLSGDAPRVLKPGDAFTLREGGRRTAEGVVEEVLEGIDFLRIRQPAAELTR